eukprot:13586385-Alexandrium_andersonii.AAC.1
MAVLSSWASKSQQGYHVYTATGMLSRNKRNVAHPRAQGTLLATACHPHEVARAAKRCPSLRCNALACHVDLCLACPPTNEVRSLTWT